MGEYKVEVICDNKVYVSKLEDYIPDLYYNIL